MAKAIGGRIDPGDPEDRLTMQQGCYILNAWGYGPRYRYDLYIRGPYSRDLAEDLRRSSDDAFGDTDVPEEAVARLRGIFDRGAGYVEAYATVLS